MPQYAIRVYMPREYVEMINVLSRADGLAMSSWIRRMVIEELDRRKRKAKR